LNVGDRVVVEMQSTTGQSNNQRFGGGFGSVNVAVPAIRNNGR
jgi:hypothetical protein